MCKEDCRLTVHEVSALTGLTTRALRWYDEIGLVVPDRNEPNDYRIYRREHLKTLQQVVFFKELGFSLTSIQRMLGDQGFNRREALKTQIELLNKKRANIEAMITTIEMALAEEKGEIQMQDTERFKGFDFSKNPYEKEASMTWGDTAVKTAQATLDNLGKMEQANLAHTMKEIFTELAGIREVDPASGIAQAAIGKWFTLLNTMGTYTPEMFANLGNMYVDDRRFTENIDSYGVGLARFMRDAMQIFAQQHGTKVK